MSKFTLGLSILFAPFRYRLSIYQQSIPPIYGDYTDLLIFISDISLVITLLLWAINITKNSRRISFGPPILSIPIAGLIIASWLSVVFSVSPLLSFYHTIRLVLLAGLYLYIVNEIKSLDEVSWFVAGMVFVQAGVGIAQVLGQRSLGLYILGELDLDTALHGISIVWSEGTSSLRAYGLSDHPNILGGCLAFALVLMAAWYLDGASARKLPGVGIFVLGALGLLLTFSHSAWLSLTTGFLFTAGLLLRTRQIKVFTKWSFLIITTLIVLTPFIWLNANYLGINPTVQKSPQLVLIDSRSSVERATLNAAANQIFASNALTGIGLGAFPIALQQMQPDFPFDYQPPHVALLNAATETGIFGAAFYFVALVGPWLALWLNRKRLSISPALIGVSGTLAAVTVVGFFDYYTWLLAPGRFWQWFVWGLWGAFYQISLHKSYNV